MKKWTGERLETFVVNETTVEHLHRYSIVQPHVSGKIVVDIACGEGYGSNLLAGDAQKVIGIDIDEEVINHAKSKYRKKNLSFLTGSADKIPISDHSVDIVVSFETIEHHDKHQEMLLEIKRILKPDGFLIISSPEKRDEKSNNPYHIKELTSAEFKQLLKFFFNYTMFYNQKVVLGSLIISEANLAKEFESHEGNFSELKCEKGFKDSVFNICFASDTEMPDLGNSFFNGSEILIKHYVSPYTNSLAYRLIKKVKSLIKW